MASQNDARARARGALSTARRSSLEALALSADGTSSGLTDATSLINDALTRRTIYDSYTLAAGTYVRTSMCVLSFSFSFFIVFLFFPSRHKHLSCTWRSFLARWRRAASGSRPAILQPFFAARECGRDRRRATGAAAGLSFARRERGGRNCIQGRREEQPRGLLEEAVTAQSPRVW